jgi:hypothetical protein
MRGGTGATEAERTEATEGAGSPLRVRLAVVEVLRTYDVAYDIDLVAVERLLQGRAPVARIRLSRVEPKALAFDDPPVVTDLVAPVLEVGGRRVETRASARIYSFGVVSISLDVLLPAPATWGGVRALRPRGGTGGGGAPLLAERPGRPGGRPHPGARPAHPPPHGGRLHAGGGA